MNPALLGSLAALCWGTLDFMAGGVSRAIGAVRVTAAVTLIGLVLITLWLSLFGEFPSLARADVWFPLVAGAGFALATLWLFAAIASGPVSLAVPITMAYPASSVALAAFLGNVPTLLQILCVLVIFAGVLMVALAESDSGDGTTRDPARLRRTIVYACLAHATFVIAVFTGQSAAPLFGEIESVWISRIAGTAVIMPLLVLGSGPVRPRISNLPVLALMGLLDVIAISLLFAAGRTEQPEIATVCATASGAVTVVLARVFLKEHIALLRWLGIGATFAGVAALSGLR